MKLEFVYTAESEVQRLNGTFRDRDFFEKYGYQVGFPEGVDFDNYEKLGNENILKLVKEELDTITAKDVETLIREGVEKNFKTLEEYFSKLPGQPQSKYVIRLTQYGTGGSYWPPQTMIINFKANNRPFSTFVHEATHNHIQAPIVVKFNLTQPEKESLVNWLMLENPQIKNIFPDDKYQKFGRPSEELLKMVGFIKKGSSEMTGQEATALSDKYNQEVADFFGIKKINIIVTLHNKKRSIFDKYHSTHPGMTAPDYLVGYSPKSGVEILSPFAMPPGSEKDGLTRFKKVLKHEICHRYVELIDTHHTAPNWLNEGTCIYVAGQNQYQEPDSVTIEILKSLEKTQQGLKYRVGHFMAHKIMKDFGKEKLFELIGMKTNDDRYDELKRMFDWLK